MSTSPEPTTPTQSRTRTAILQAALQVFMGDRSASLSEVARRAEVARSTVHRYFPSIADLKVALTEYSREQVQLVAERSHIQDGQALDALIRVALEYYEHWDAVMWDYAASYTEDAAPEPTEFDLEISERIAQGQADGSIDPNMPADWVQHTMFAIVYSAWEYTRSGNPPSQAAMMVMATMRKVMAPTNNSVTPPANLSNM